MVAIINYGMGNLASVQKALNFLNIPNTITADPAVIKDAEYVILPGVGSFIQAMKNLSDRGLVDVLNEEVIVKKKKFLGICLGMQLIFENGTEPVNSKGLGWIPGTIKKLELENLRIPHMGWNNITVVKDDFYKGIPTDDFYFIHSYHAVPDDTGVIAATVDYGFPVVASVQSGNIFATQFHPEKSQEAGLSILKSFFSQHA